MGLTERHWFENEEPELTDRQLEDAVSIRVRFYSQGYYKGYSDRDKEIVRCKDCKHYRIDTVYPGTNMITTYCAKMGFPAINPDWFCADGVKRE